MNMSNNMQKKTISTLVKICLVLVLALTFNNIEKSNNNLVHAQAATLEKSLSFDEYVANEKNIDPEFSKLVTDFLADTKWNSQSNPEVKLINLSRYAASKNRLRTFLGSTLINSDFTGKTEILDSLNKIINTGVIEGNPENPYQKGQSWLANKLEPIKWSSSIQSNVNEYVLADVLKQNLVHSQIGDIAGKNIFITHEALAYSSDLLSAIREWIIDSNNIHAGWGHRTHILQEETEDGALSASQGSPTYGKVFLYQTGVWNEQSFTNNVVSQTIHSAPMLSNNHSNNSSNSNNVQVINKIVHSWVKRNNKWYYYNNQGNIVKNFQKISNKWYYFDSNGVRQTGFKKISNKWYFFNSSGVRQTGFKKISNKWYFFNSSGVRQTGRKRIAGKWYYFNSSGVKRTGWIRINHRLYHFK